MRNTLGQFSKGITPKNKIVIPESQLRDLYKKSGTSIIARQLGVSKQTVLRNLDEYGIPKRCPGAPSELPGYWKASLQKPKSKANWAKGHTKETHPSLKRVSLALSGENSPHWIPELHEDKSILCACGCGAIRPERDNRGRIRKYLPGHCPQGRFSSNRVSGPNNNHWKGGITPINDAIRKSEEYSNWRRTVYIRDEYTCQVCGQKHIDIVAHHIKSFADYPTLRFDPENGIVLCRACHLSLHRRANKGRGGCKTNQATGKGRKKG